jgi:dCMP deaminase
MKEITSNLSWDAYFMKHVYLAASKSKDPRTKMGAVLVKDGVVISEGYNGFARGVKDFEDRYIDRATKYKYVVHAEVNAVLNAARRGVSTFGSVCYTQHPPCHECMKTLLQAGISEVVTHSTFPSMRAAWGDSCDIADNMRNEAGVKARVIDDVLGIETRINGENSAV